MTAERDMRQAAYRLLDEALALMAENRRDEALSRFDAALAAAQKDGSPEARALVARNAGLAYEHYQQLNEAVRCFEIAVTNDPFDGRGYLTLAMLEQRRGDVDAAKAHANRALQIASETGDEELRSFVERSGLSPRDGA